MSKAKRWARQIGNLLSVAFVLWIALSILEIGGSSCTVIGRDYSVFNFFEIARHVFGY